jgi:large subunit ribosomal protein L6
MSRLGRTPIEIPKGVELKIGKNGHVHIKGPKGALDLYLPEGLSAKVEGTQVLVEHDANKGATSALYGLYRSLLKNHVVGVTEGYEVKLTMIGVGYRAAVQGNKLDLQVGFSHPTVLEIPKTIKILIDKGTTMIIQGIDKKEVGQFAAAVRSMKPPEPYKGKGIRYENEYVRKKEGKAAKGKA